MKHSQSLVFVFMFCTAASGAENGRALAASPIARAGDAKTRVDASRPAPPRHASEQQQRSLARRNVWVLPYLQHHVMKSSHNRIDRDEEQTEDEQKQRQVVRMDNASQSMNTLNIGQSEQHWCTTTNITSAVVQAGKPQKNGNIAAEGSRTLVNLSTKGSVLVSNVVPVDVSAGSDTVVVQPGAIAYVIKTPHELAVLNLDSHASPDVAVKCAGTHLLRVPVSKMLVLTANDNPGDSQLVKYLQVANTKKLDPVDGQNAYLADFSYTSAFDKCPQLLACVHSTKPSEKKMADALFKSAAAAMTVNHGR